MSNFQFLKDEWPDIFKEASECEQMVMTHPRSSVMIARVTLKKAVHWLYEHDDYLQYPYDQRLSALIHERCFSDILKPSMLREVNLIRKMGNNAAHGKHIKQDQSIATFKYLFRFLSFLGVYYGESDIKAPQLDMSLVPDGSVVKESQKMIDQLSEALDKRKELDRIKSKQLEERAAEVDLLRQQLEATRKELTERRIAREQEVATVAEPIPIIIPESETRRLYIDVMLREAGWLELAEGREIEYEVKGMPLSTNRTGIGYADYVLWGQDGLPLAVIEAKRTMEDARKGRHQAVLYAECLEQMHGQRPVIFYTNGFETYIWDDTFYIDRQVQGFYAQDELQLLVNRRQTRKDPRNFAVDMNIAGRDYQIMAIQRIAENLVVDGEKAMRGKNRKSLLIMATGSGKTRTSAAVVDMLTKCNWVKRVLFLADRNALVTQAKDGYKEYLPELSAIDLTREKEDKSTRLVFSTYPTMMNKIDKVRSGDERFYGVGHFDLIIIDEAHRSVYQKYGAIFDYFDAMMLGLTATPKDDIDKNTYMLFDIEDNNPTFSYTLDEAVEDKYLVPYRALSVPLKFQREGVKYHELSEAEQAEYEEKFGDPTQHEAPDIISNSALNKWLFNTDTVDKVLAHLMTDGIKVEGGDKIGKTIIFAKNHAHAIFIEERFNKMFPEYGATFLRVIDNYETKAQDLLDKFKDVHTVQEPQIAVSVDMMDTGVDAPRVVNLVFFKMVKSSSKFWQMIGRGTRLCPDLFGPDQDKKHFLIFDYCENFEFFNENPQGITSKVVKPLTQQIFENKLDIAQLISGMSEKSDEDKQLRDQYLEELHKSIAALDRDRFMVQRQLRHVEEYSHANRWTQLSKSDVQDIKAHISHLQPPQQGDDELARRFDVTVLLYQKAILLGAKGQSNYQGKIYYIVSELAKKDNIPQIAQRMDILDRARTEQYWENVQLKQLEELRISVRDLVKYLDQNDQQPVYTSFEDELDLDNVTVHDIGNTYINLDRYKERVERYIREHKDHLVIGKLYKNVPITDDELKQLEDILFTDSLAGTREEYENRYNGRPIGEFVRSVTGLEREAVQSAFASFLQAGNLRADQMTFIKTVISYFCTNGVIDKRLLYESPFTDLNDQGLSGVFDNDAQLIQLVKIIDSINDNAG